MHGCGRRRRRPTSSLQKYGLRCTCSPAIPIPRKPYSKQTQRQVDQEVARLLGEAEDRMVSLLKRHRAALDRLASVLMDQETVDGGAVLNSLRDEPAPDTEGRGDLIPAAPRGK